MDLLELKRRVVLNPEDVETRFALAEAFLAEKHLDAARAQLEKCLERDPRHANALRLLSTVHKAKEDHTEAIKALARLVDASPENPETHEALADALLANERPDDALVALVEAARLEPPSPQRYAKAADLAERTRRVELARGLLEHALVRWPTDLQLTERRAELIKRLGEDDAFDLVGALQPGDGLLDVSDALIHEDAALARKLLVAASTTDDQRPAYHLLRAELMSLEGDEARAAKSFDKARSLTRHSLAPLRLAAAVKRGVFRRMGVLGWTPFGGAVSPLEAVAVPGKGELFFSGNVKGTGLEAGQVAYNCLKARAAPLGIAGDVVKKDLHLNFTDSEMGKEGLSSGLALALAGLAAFSGKKLRSRLGATGALTLFGEVQRVEGIHEKLTAAYLVGLERILMPRPNRSAVEALPARTRARLQVIYVSTLEDAVPHAVE